MIPTGTTLEQKHFPRATIAIIIANIAVFAAEPLLLQLLDDRIRSLTFGPGNLSPLGLFTSIFLHADLFHIIFNMLFLWVFGPPVEDRVGPRLYLAYYIGAGVAANIIEAVIEVLHNSDSHMVGIGASGAISGIMALYLYRCFYSKVKMVVSPMFLPFNVNIPAAPVLLFWFFQDVFYGIVAFKQPSNIGHWAHVGGFLFGLAVGRIKRYGHEAAVEHYSGKILDQLRSGGGWSDLKSEKELLKLASISPNDPDMKLQLAQYYTAKGDTVTADACYKEAIQKFFIKNPLYGAYAVLEYQEALGKATAFHYHVKAAEVLTEEGYIEEAYKAVGPVMNEAASGALAEKAHLLFIKICRELGRDDEATEGTARFKSLFPRSRYQGEAEKSALLMPGGIFPKKQTAVEKEGKETLENPGPQAGKRNDKVMLLMQHCMKIITDPFFLFLWLILVSVYGILIPLTWTIQMLTFFLAFVFAASIRIDWGGLYRDMTIDEEAARREADASTLYNRAVLADRGENYPKAAELYEKLLAVDSCNIQARFNLARIYHKKVGDRNNALRQYRKLLDILPQDHPFRFESEEAIKSGCK